jgi:hypothetical protein
LGEFSPIGRLFNKHTLGIFLKITKAAQIFGLLFSSGPVMYYFDKKMGWATFWATFSKTHLVTLPGNYCKGGKTPQRSFSRYPKGQISRVGT